MTRADVIDMPWDELEWFAKRGTERRRSEQRALEEAASKAKAKR